MASPITKIKKVGKFVEDILNDYPQSRESDNYLCAVVWHKQVRASNQGDVTFENFLTMYSNGLLASADSITRSARKLKETNHKYRGKNYENRKQLEIETRMNINKL